MQGESIYSVKLTFAGEVGGTPLKAALTLATGSIGSMSQPSKAVILSYASQDAEAARRICEALWAVK